MTQVIINIPNESDTDWVIKLLNRLQLDFNVTDENSVLSEEKAEYLKNKNIIQKGSSMTLKEADEMLDWIKEQRQDRPLPFRD
jgi:hypothetical protein